MSNIVLATLTYVGNGIVNGISSWTERSSGLAGYFRELTAKVTAGKGVRTSIKWKVVQPFPATPPSECPCPGELPYTDTIVDITVRMDPRAGAAHRTAVVTAIQNLSSSTQFVDSIEDLVQVT